MGDCRGREAPRRIQSDVVVQEVNRTGHQGGKQQDPQKPVLDRDIDRQREEVEPDVLVEQRIVPAVWRLIEEPEDEVPPFGLAHGDEQSEDERDGEDDETPYQWRRL